MSSIRDVDSNTELPIGAQLKKLIIFKNPILQEEYELHLKNLKENPIAITEKHMEKINRGKELAANLFKKKITGASPDTTIKA